MAKKELNRICISQNIVVKRDTILSIGNKANIIKWVNYTIRGRAKKHAWQVYLEIDLGGKQLPLMNWRVRGRSPGSVIRSRRHCRPVWQSGSRGADATIIGRKIMEINLRFFVFLTFNPLLRCKTVFKAGVRDSLIFVIFIHEKVSRCYNLDKAKACYSLVVNRRVW